MSASMPVGTAPPVGSVMAYAGNESALASSGWLVCDGRQISSAEWPLLVRALGSVYGGDGVNTAFLPDLRGRFVRGVDSGAGNDPDVSRRTPASPNGTTGVGSSQSDALANHLHQWDHFFYVFNYSGNDIACHQPPNSPNLQNNTETATNQDGNMTPDSSGVETRPKNIALYWIIRAA